MADHRDDDGPILVIDDDPHLRDAIARILEHEGHAVITAGDGPTAIEMTKAHAPGLLVLDYMLPEMNGEMILGALREAIPDDVPPALLLTACGEAFSRATQMGCVIGLEKPFRIKELLAAVEQHRRKVATERS
ncbi:MAG: response regulator transcription factor [Myxococcales bacterium]|nr:response regulator transcription factor [Myxococcales bacterium]